MKETLRWNADGLVAAVVQDAVSGRVLMLGWMNAEALERTTSTGRVHFFSRRRRTLWRKGETSGNELRLRSLTADCDGDAVLVRAEPAGPTCHTGRTSCFFEELGDAPDACETAELGPVLAALTRIVKERARTRPAGSGTARLLDAGVRRVAQKVGEEGVEVALAACRPGATGKWWTRRPTSSTTCWCCSKCGTSLPDGSPPSCSAASPPATAGSRRADPLSPAFHPRRSRRPPRSGPVRRAPPALRAG